MQMIWLLRVLAPAKKVHFNLNGSELRGFPIKTRSGHSNILYANPLAPNAEVCFCLVLLSLPEESVPTAAVCQRRWFSLRILTCIYSCHMYRLENTFPNSIHFTVSLNALLFDCSPHARTSVKD